MKKKDMERKLASLGVKGTGGKTVAELKAMLDEARHDTSKPGSYIGREDIASSGGKGAEGPRG